jgi:hypothetical protein
VSEARNLLKKIAVLRFEIRARRVEMPAVREAVELMLGLENHNPWKAEFSFVIAMAYEIRGEDESASTYYRSASKFFDLCKIPKKSVKALQNYLAAESRVHPEKKLFVDYHYVYRKAKKCQEYAAAGVALANISREYQNAGAFSLALKYANRAAAILKKDFGSIHYFLTIAHRAHLLFEMGRVVEAKNDFEELSLGQFQEVIAAKEALAALFAGKRLEANANLIFNWQERVKEKRENSIRTKAVLSALEEKFVHFLSEAPREKYDIILYLYGEGVDLEVAENRFKNLLGRLRKKCSELLVFENGKYRLADDSIAGEYLRKVS